MNLAIDFGNTTVKAGIFENNILKEKLTNITSVELSRVINAHADYNVILCSVSAESTHFLNLIEKKDKLTIWITKQKSRLITAMKHPKH